MVHLMRLQIVQTLRETSPENNRLDPSDLLHHGTPVDVSETVHEGDSVGELVGEEVEGKVGEKVEGKVGEEVEEVERKRENNSSEGEERKEQKEQREEQEPEVGEAPTTEVGQNEGE